jgi:hypothetical protein
MALESEVIRLIASSRAKQKYTEISDEERAAYVRVSGALQNLGNLLKSNLTNSYRFEVRTRSDPVDSWFRY